MTLAFGRLARVRPALAAALVLGCGASAPAALHREPSGEIRYEVTLAPTLETLSVSVCGALPGRLVPIHDAGRDRFDGAAADDGTRLSGPVIEVPAGTECVTYRVRLTGGGGNPDAPYPLATGVYAPTSSWLWAPTPRDPSARYPVVIHLPEGMGHSAFLRRDGEGRYSLGEAAFHYVGYAAFGRLERFVVPAPGGCIEVAAFEGAPPRAALEGWMRGAADAASRALGHLPRDEVSVVVLPLGPFYSGGDPLAFGMAAHGERPTLLAYAFSDAPASALAHDWVAVHELSHLGHAFLEGRSAWLTEGIATYYETVLRARAGWVDAELALDQLDGGFRRGERDGTGRTLHDESEARHRTGAYDRVYWAGAAIALMIDVALRAEGSSLDAALLRAEGTRQETLTDEELLLALDGGTPGTATAIARTWMDSTAFPELGPTYDALGVRRGPTGLETTGDGALRQALFGESPPLSPVPERCEL